MLTDVDGRLGPECFEFLVDSVLAEPGEPDRDTGWVVEESPILRARNQIVLESTAIDWWPAALATGEMPGFVGRLFPLHGR